MEITFHITTSLHGVHVILKTITRTRTLKGGGFGLTRVEGSVHVKAVLERELRGVSFS